MSRDPVDYTDPVYWNGLIKMSLSKFFILRALHERPMHGYQIARAVEATTRGCCSPGEGTIYPVLKDFQAGGYVTSHSQTVNGRERRVYALTARGRAAFKVAVGAWLGIAQSLKESQEILENEA